MAVTAAARSVGQGLGRKARRRVRASSGRMAPLRAAGASSGSGRGAGQHDRALGALGALDQALGMGDARGPARRRRPAVVDHQHQRAAARQVGLRIEERPGDGQDQRGGEQQAQQQQPPRHLHRRLLGRLEPDQQPDRREAHQLGQRRDHAQQPVDHRQHQQQRQHAGCGEREGAEAQHEARHSSRTAGLQARS